MSRFTCGDRAQFLESENVVCIVIADNKYREYDTMRHLCYVKYDVNRGCSSIETRIYLTTDNKAVTKGDFGYIGEKIRCLRQRVTGQILRKHCGGDIYFCTTEMGNYFVTHKRFTISFINTRLCDFVEPDEEYNLYNKRHRSDTRLADEMLQTAEQLQARLNALRSNRGSDDEIQMAYNTYVKNDECN